MIREKQSKGQDFFRNNEIFYINRVNEFIKDSCVYHSHDFVEICYVCTGKGYHLVDGRQYKVYKGDLFIINYDISHTFYKESPNDTLITYNIIFKPGFLDYALINSNEFNSLTMSYLFRNLYTDDFIKEDLRLNLDEQEDLGSLIIDMYREYTLLRTGYMGIIRAYMIELILKIMRCFSNRTPNTKCFNENAGIINSALEYLNENYSKSLSLNDLAIKCFLSKNYFCRLFKETTGMTMSEYVQSLRVNEACKLLKTTDKRLTDIALEIGFNDYKLFCSNFKRLKGMRPGEYKKQHPLKHRI